MPFEREAAEFQARLAAATAMGSPQRLAERAAAGILNARQRVAELCDADSFTELGALAVSARREMRGRSPADGVVCGFGRIAGRLAGVTASDFTVLGSSSAEIHGKKQQHVRQVCEANGHPIVHLMECAGGRIPDIMGAAGIGRAGEGARYSRTRVAPALSAALGLTYGGGAFTCIKSDLTVMRKGAVLAVSSQMVTSVAISEEIDPQALGGWELHSETAGLVDAVVDTDAEAIAWLKRALSYLPDNRTQPPPVAAVPPGAEDGVARLLDIVPEGHAKTYDIRKVIAAIADPGSVLPLKERFAKVAVTALARLRGQVIGMIATNPMFKGGALDPDACDKIAGFIVLCDSFNIPLVFLADTPGFLVGVESERRRLPVKIMTFMAALERASVPKIALVLRKSYGQAYLNMGGGKADTTGAWFTGEISFMDPAVAVNIVHAVRRESDPERYDALVREVADETSAYALAAPFMAHAVIDPRETRNHLAAMLAVHGRRLTNGVGRHLLADWPPGF